MFGKILGKVLALPARVADVPFAIIDKAVDGDGQIRPMRDAARAIEDGFEDAIDDDDDEGDD